MTVINNHGTTWEQLKQVGPRPPTPLSIDGLDRMGNRVAKAPKVKLHKKSRRCEHTRKHHTAAGGCRKCDKLKRTPFYRTRKAFLQRVKAGM